MQRINIGYHARDHFVPFHRRTQRWACVVAHRRCGKTYAAIHDVVDHALRTPKTDARYALGAPTYSQVKDVMWQYLKRATSKLPDVEVNESELWVQLHNGSRIRLYALDTSYERMRGIYLDGIVMDEYADINPKAWDEVIRPALSDRQGWAVWIGTSKGRDAFYKVWREAETHPDQWFCVKLKGSETGVLPAHEMLDMERTLGPATYAREIECSFDEADVNQFISGEDIKAAQNRKAEKNGPRLIGVDVARFGDDRTVIVTRNGDFLDEVFCHRGIDTMQTVGNVITAIEAYNPDAVFIDVVGIGAGVVDRLKQLRYRIIEVNAGAKAMNDSKFMNVRAEMWFKMKAWLKDRAQIPVDHALADDLTALTFEFDHRNRLKLESKEDLKKRGLPSPDIADAIALTFAQPIAPKEIRDVLHSQPNAGDYDPFNTASRSYARQDTSGVNEYQPFS